MAIEVTLSPGDIDFLADVVDFIQEILDSVIEEDE